MILGDCMCSLLHTCGIPSRHAQPSRERAARNLCFRELILLRPTAVTSKHGEHTEGRHR
jgi:hypothetical protein